MRFCKPFFFIFFLGFIACSSDEGDNLQLNSEVSRFLNQVIDIMEANSINKSTIDWSDFRNQVLTRGASAQNVSETDDALELALGLLGDNHSFIRKQDESFISASNLNCQLSSLETVTVPDNIGYIQISSFFGSDQTAQVAFAEGIQQSISTQDSQDIIGWIVDLRNNSGGNMWPMLAGIGPILGEGTAGFFVGPDYPSIQWYYSFGSAINGNSAIVSLSSPYELINPNPKVAVLLNKAVGSSGEAIAVSFIGRPNTRSFGSETCGLSTANSGFSLSDGSTLFLTVAYMADRNQNSYGVPIVPDVPSTDETIIQEAINYLSN